MGDRQRDWEDFQQFEGLVAGIVAEQSFDADAFVAAVDRIVNLCASDDDVSYRNYWGRHPEAGALLVTHALRWRTITYDLAHVATLEWWASSPDADLLRRYVAGHRECDRHLVTLHALGVISAMFRYSKQRSEAYVVWPIIERELVKLDTTDLSAAAVLDISDGADVWGLIHDEDTCGSS